MRARFLAGVGAEIAAPLETRAEVTPEPFELLARTSTHTGLDDEMPVIEQLVEDVVQLPSCWPPDWADQALAVYDDTALLMKYMLGGDQEAIAREGTSEALTERGALGLIFGTAYSKSFASLSKR